MIPSLLLAIVPILPANPALGVKVADSITLHDAARERDIPIKIYYAEGGPPTVPLIVFSHGFGGNKEGYEYLGRGWAEAGYVVILPTHLGSDHVAVLQVGAKLARDEAASFQLQQGRTADIEIVLSSLDLIEHSVPELAGRIDRTRIGVAGHSMGAGTALLLAGATAAPPGGARWSARDPQVRAAIAMSPQGPGEEGFDQTSWNNLTIPVMTMSGTMDFGIDRQPPSWRREAFAHMPPGDKYQVVVNGARHLSFATGEQFHPCIVAESLAFWNVYLKNDVPSKSQLATQGACELTAK